MKHISCLVFLILILISCNRNEEKKYQAFKDFLKYYQANVLKKGKSLVILKEPTERRKYDEIWNTITIDSLLPKQFAPLAIKEWDSSYFKDSRFVSSEETTRFRYDLNLQRKFYDEHQGFYTLSQPYVSKAGDYILIAMYYICGDRCGYGKLQLFKAHQKTWVLVKTYSTSIS
ncbi:hypothetical protein [Pedobacter xixiisoli]|uniref:Lipoprotein n=1 Tax=Pedobacter xixiisoli TaxID=1476464 RepID=A0A285ZPD4_9SPHI|nr:hypothetical protein [Pedobacter xixiisoli]SOD11479.1 hypothetical protein SAMN06297358_0171 [Pedobacter xixiisoli]